MLINEYQVMQLVSIAHVHLACLQTINAPEKNIDHIKNVLNNIMDSQSDDLVALDHTISDSPLHQKPVCFRCGYGVYRNE